jgi:hypothetical protein
MGRTYAVSWQDEQPTGERRVGKLVVNAASARLEGGARGHSSSQTIPAADLREVQLDRTPTGRVDGRPSILLSLRNGSLVRVVSLDQPGTVPEIANRLAALVHGAH